MQINSLMIQSAEDQKQYEALQKGINDQRQRNANEIQELKIKNAKELNDLDLTKTKLESDLHSRAEDIKRQRNMEEELKKLQEDIAKEKIDGKIQINETEREKIQAIDKLRQEMMFKIKETKANLYALNNEQLQTTTRLTILQNHQLTTELEHQSKQTEELLDKNKHLVQQIEQAKRDIEIHKEMEKELAKRSHFCQKVIKKLKKQAEDLEHERDDLPKPSTILDGTTETRLTNKDELGGD